MTVIITDVHYRAAIAPIRDLGEAGHSVIGCETDAFPHPVGFASRFCREKAVLDSNDHLNALLRLCGETARRDGEKPVLLIIGASTLRLACENAERFHEVCRVLLPEEEQLALLNDKAALSEYAKKIDIPVPADFVCGEDENEDAFFARVPLPCVVKPLCGEQFGLKAAQRYRICKTRDALREAYAHFRTVTSSVPVVQEYLSGEALGCSVLAKNGEILASVCHHRIREYPVSGGPSSCCESIFNDELNEYAAALVRATGFSGLAMFEFKCTADGAPRLLECNPRVWGSYPLTRAAGTNFSLLWAQASGGETTAEFCRGNAVKMRYLPADLLAALGYLKSGKTRAALRGLADLFSPKVRGGLFSFADPGPGWRYFCSLFERIQDR